MYSEPLLALSLSEAKRAMKFMIVKVWAMFMLAWALVVFTLYLSPTDFPLNIEHDGAYTLLVVGSFAFLFPSALIGIRVWLKRDGKTIWREQEMVTKILFLSHRATRRNGWQWSIVTFWHQLWRIYWWNRSAALESLRTTGDMESFVLSDPMETTFERALFDASGSHELRWHEVIGVIIILLVVVGVLFAIASLL